MCNVNDVVDINFRGFKEVRQVDPLSSFLFNIAINCLERMVKLAQGSDQIVGLITYLIDKGVEILQYADDTIPFVQDDAENVRKMKLLLYIFEQIFRLKINFQNSEVIMVMHDDEREQMYDVMFNCQLGSWPIKYMGVLVYGIRLHVEDRAPIKENMYKRLDYWEAGTLTLSGRGQGLMRVRLVCMCTISLCSDFLIQTLIECKQV